MSAIEEAAKLIQGERNDSYGHPLDNHTRTAALWSAYLGTHITAEQVCWMNVLQKISRTCNGVYHHDNIVDVCGFAGNVEMIHEERKKRT